MALAQRRRRRVDRAPPARRAVAATVRRSAGRPAHRRRSATRSTREHLGIGPADADGPDDRTSREARRSGPRRRSRRARTASPDARRARHRTPSPHRRAAGWANQACCSRTELVGEAGCARRRGRRPATPRPRSPSAGRDRVGSAGARADRRRRRPAPRSSGPSSGGSSTGTSRAVASLCVRHRPTPPSLSISASRWSPCRTQRHPHRHRCAVGDDERFEERDRADRPLPACPLAARAARNSSMWPVPGSSGDTRGAAVLVDEPVVTARPACRRHGRCRHARRPSRTAPGGRPVGLLSIAETARDGPRWRRSPSPPTRRS